MNSRTSRATCSSAIRPATRSARPASASRLTIGIATAAVAALALVGCSTSPSVTDAPEGSLRVVATTTQLADFATQIGGDDIELTSLLSPGASAHHFDPSPADLLALGNADVLIVNGAGLETFIDSSIEASGFNGTIITAADGIDLDEARAITLEAEHDDHDHDHAEADDHTDEVAAEQDPAHVHDDEADTGGDDHADHDQADHDHADHDHDHDHGDLNPHIWTAPRLAQGMAAEIGRGLAAADAVHARDYGQRADAYIAQLDALDTWAAAQFERVPEPNRVLVSGHDSLRYYLHDYDIEFAGSLLPSFDDNAEPSAAEIDALVATITERGVKAVFVESSMSPKLAQTVARDAGVAVIDETALHADSLAAPGSPAATYIGATIENTRTILEAWGTHPDPVPVELESL